MPSPFPGMDPYLESPTLWPDVHHGLISHIQIALNPALRPRYVARVELRVYISDDDDPGREVLIPDVRVEKLKRRGAKKLKGASTVAIAEALYVPLLVDDEIEEARIEIRNVESGSLVTMVLPPLGHTTRPANTAASICAGVGKPNSIRSSSSAAAAEARLAASPINSSSTTPLEASHP